MKRSLAVAALALLLGATDAAQAQTAKAPYPTMAPIEAYRMKSRTDEIALARSAAPAAIAKDAEILVLGSKGYESAAKGTNGFTCIVIRAWANKFDHADFWNPKIRAPHCFNPAGARSVLPTYLKRTEWVLAGVAKDEMESRTKQAVAAKEITPPEIGSMCYMLSKGGYLGDDVGGAWRPHLMFYLPPTEPATWGANLPDVQVFADTGGVEPVTVFFAPVRDWSDGTPGPMPKKQMKM
ncbi:hypothetical protein [Roseiterribacter gracilis]|uniref:Uncharacterized protein n=1 Tax=Roseiterribacter gracilis TaxID=2812848 RepID=A0A8S8XET5_9PROT|nr:hypothetical protein TMPK1_18820 [Rhodospirillales bacterium TMPK1]